MNRRHLTLTALALAAVAACAPPHAEPARLLPVRYVIANTDEARTWCIDHPGGALEWDANGNLICRIVPWSRVTLTLDDLVLIEDALDYYRAATEAVGPDEHSVADIRRVLGNIGRHLSRLEEEERA